MPVIHLSHRMSLPASLARALGYGRQPCLECARGEAGQVEAVEQLLIRHGTALGLDFVRTDDRSLPFKHKVTVIGPYQLRSSLWPRRA